MKNTILLLTTLFYFNLSAQEVSVKWSEQTTDFFIKNDKGELEVRTGMYNEKTNEFVIGYKSETSILIKKIDFLTGKESGSKKIDFPLEKSTKFTGSYFEIKDGNLNFYLSFVNLKTEAVKYLLNVYDGKTLVELSSEIIDNPYKKKAIDTNLPIDDENSRVNVESKKTALNNPKIVLKAGKYISDDVNEQFVLFDDYSEKGEEAELKFSLKDKGGILLSSKLNLKFSQSCILDEVRTDNKKNCFFLFAEIFSKKQLEINGIAPRTLYARGFTQKYYLVAIDSKGNQTVFSIDNLKSDERGFYHPKLAVDYKKENIYLGTLCSTEKKLGDLRYVNNVYNINTKTITEVISKCKPEIITAMDAIDGIFVCDGKFVYDNSDPTVGTTFIYEDHRGSNGGVMSDYMARTENNAIFSNTAFVFRFGFKGELKTQSAILKNQRKTLGLQSEFFGSFYHFISNNKVILIFNDNPKNLANTTSKKSDAESPFTVIATVDENGAVTKKAANEFNTPKGFFFSPKFTKSLGNNQYLVCHSQLLKGNLVIGAMNFGILTIK